MTSSPLVRFSAIAAPVLLFLYGTLRLIDGLDGHHDRGFLWNAGHTMFFVAFVLLGVLTVAMRQFVPTPTPRHRLLANLATLGGVFGAACFLWVIAGDLSAGFRDAAPLPGVLEIIGPLLFQLGVLTLLVQLVRARLLPAWSPVAVFFGFIAIAVNLDLIPVAAILVLLGLLPLAGARFRNGSQPAAR